MKLLEGKVAIVTGAGAGIGAGVAAEFAAQGASVIVADINGDGANAIADQISASGATAIGTGVDVADEGAVASMVALAIREFGRLDILHNNAAATQLAVQDEDLLSMDAEVWDRTMAVNLRGPMLGCKHAIPHMVKAGGGVILNTSSGAGILGEPTRPGYGASKAALNMLTRYVALRYGKQNIRCVAIAPGIVIPVGAEAHFAMAGGAGWLEMMKRHHATPYIGHPHDIGKVAAFLASDDARFITGSVIPVEGGITAGVGYTAEMHENGYGLF